MFLRQIPKDSSPDKYISGFAALNLPAPEGTSGDWHFFNNFYSNSEGKQLSFIAGIGMPDDTTSIWGHYGIYNCGAALRDRGLKFPEERPIFAANHTRAILDILWRNIKNKTQPAEIFDATVDFLDTKVQALKLFDLLLKLPDNMDEEQMEIFRSWVQNEKRRVEEDFSGEIGE